MSILERLGVPAPQHLKHQGRRIIVSMVQRQVRIPHPLFQQWESYKQIHPEDSLNGRLLKLLAEYLQVYNVKPPDLSVYPVETGDIFPQTIDPPIEE